MSCVLLPALVLLCLCCLVVLSQGESVGCPSPLYSDLNDNDTSDVKHFTIRGAIILLPDIRFNCSGYIKSIEAWMHLDQVSTSHYLEYQIWRPSTNTLLPHNTEFNVVGDALINDNTQNEDITSNIRKYNYTGNSGKLQFQKNDIFGMFVPDPLSGDPFLPTYVNASNGEEGVRLYWAKSDYTICSVALCSNGFTLMPNLDIQIKIEQEITNSPTSPRESSCLSNTDLLMCDSLETSSMAIMPTISFSIMTTTSTTPTQSTTSEGGGESGLPLYVLVGVPVGGTILLITLVTLLVIACLCLKQGRNMLKRNTEKVHHYNADNGSEYAFPMKMRKGSREEDLTDGDTTIQKKEKEKSEKIQQLEAVIISDEEHETSDLLTPLPNDLTFSIGSPTTSILPYAALVSFPPVGGNSDATRGRSATVSGPVKHPNKPKMNMRVSMPALDIAGINEAKPYLEAASSMNNITSLPPPLPPRLEEVRKISQPPRVSSATTRKTSHQQFRTPRISSAKERKTSQPTPGPQQLAQLKFEDKRKISHPAKFPNSSNNGLPPSPNTQQRNQKLNESSLSLTLGPLPLRPDEKKLQKKDKSFSTMALPIQPTTTRASPRPLHGGKKVSAPGFAGGGGQPSPYMEPSSTTQMKRLPNKKLEKSFSHDVLMTGTETSPVSDKKNSDGGPSPYLEPTTSPKKPRKIFGTNDRKLSVPQRGERDTRGHTLPHPNNRDHGNFAYMPPEAMGKKREPHTGQVLSGQPTSATDMPPPPSPPPPPPHSPPPPPLPDNSTRPPRRTLISTTSTLVELISPTHSEQGEDSPSKDQLFNDADEQLCVPDSSARQLWEGRPDFEIYSKLERSDGVGRTAAANDAYCAPPSSTDELYNTLSNQKYREIVRSQIGVTGETLGTGHFANVYKGIWSIREGKLYVAAKTLKPNAPYDEEVKFLQEAVITGQFMHPHIVQLHGVVTLGKPLMIILELMTKGDLKSYLKVQKKNITNENINQEKLLRQFISFARNIASGMDYLSGKSFVHRDLAARNIFLTDNLTCKIGDFGMARDLANDDCYEASGTTIPLRWTAPEAVDYRRYTSASDVWSYGMLLYEMWSVGHKPFYSYKNHEILELLRVGFCQAPPPGCSRGIYRLMVKCWDPHGHNRPVFGDIVEYLAQPDEAFLGDRDEELGEVGGDMNEGQCLHLDLQNSYTTSSVQSSTLGSMI